MFARWLVQWFEQYNSTLDLNKTNAKITSHIFLAFMNGKWRGGGLWWICGFSKFNIFFSKVKSYWKIEIVSESFFWFETQVCATSFVNLVFYSRMFPDVWFLSAKCKKSNNLNRFCSPPWSFISIVFYE